MFQIGKGVWPEKAGKAGNSGDTAYFILKRTGKSGYGINLRAQAFFPRSQVELGNGNESFMVKTLPGNLSI